MIDLERDKKSDTWLVTTTDKEGFHRQLNVTTADMKELFKQFWKTYLLEE